jgi:hypothetical protein
MTLCTALPLVDVVHTQENVLKSAEWHNSRQLRVPRGVIQTVRFAAAVGVQLLRLRRSPPLCAIMQAHLPESANRHNSQQHRIHHIIDVLVSLAFDVHNDCALRHPIRHHRCGSQRHVEQFSHWGPKFLLQSYVNLNMFQCESASVWLRRGNGICRTILRCCVCCLFGWFVLHWIVGAGSGVQDSNSWIVLRSEQHCRYRDLLSSGFILCRWICTRGGVHLCGGIVLSCIELDEWSQSSIGFVLHWRVRAGSHLYMQLWLRVATCPHQPRRQRA